MSKTIQINLLFIAFTVITIILSINFNGSNNAVEAFTKRQSSTTTTKRNTNHITTNHDGTILIGCQHPIYCDGPILTMIQLSQVFNDSKTFVDMPMKYSADVILEQFNQLLVNTSTTGGPDVVDLQSFLDRNFLPAGIEVETVSPVDWIPNPSFLNDITNEQIKLFATGVHYKWLELTRTFNTTGMCDECFSSIPVDYPFVIAGQRFREFYYWDSYWAIHGLLISEMTTTAKGMLINFRDLIAEYGFIPNGGRIYYLNRSQPPLFTQMVKTYVDATGDLEFLEETLPILEIEYQWWMKYRSIQINGVVLNLYNVSNNMPRPESYYEDYTGAQVFPTVEQKNFYYSSIASGAESGWDFSTRWTSKEDPLNLETIETIDILPVDLNSIMLLNEQIMAEFYLMLGNTSQAGVYQTLALERSNAIQKVFYNSQASQWFDFNIKNGLTTSKDFYTSNLQPLFSGIANEHFANITTDEIDQLLKSLSPILTGYEGGVPTSIILSGQQWDFPNAWAPLQYYLIETLMDLNTTLSNSIGTSLINRWITTNYCGWYNTLEKGGLMFEKYNVSSIGVPGGGGEYTVQTGFTWSNSVALYLIKKYNNIISLNSC